MKTEDANALVEKMAKEHAKTPAGKLEKVIGKELKDGIIGGFELQPKKE